MMCCRTELDPHQTDVNPLTNIHGLGSTHAGEHTYPLRKEHQSAAKNKMPTSIGFRGMIALSAKLRGQKPINKPAKQEHYYAKT